MHEMSITQNLLDLALRHGKSAGVKKIIGLNLVIGELSSIVDDSVQFYWEFIAQGTIAEGAELHFERLPAILHCQDCGQEFARNEDYRCPACQSQHITVASGDEFYLKSIEVEE